MPKNDIDKIREEIEDCDELIADELKKRFSLAKKLGKLKKNQKLSNLLKRKLKKQKDS